jgi:hypothetical protein
LFLPGEKNGAKTGQTFNIAQSVVGEAKLNHKARQTRLCRVLKSRGHQMLVGNNKTSITYPKTMRQLRS